MKSRFDSTSFFWLALVLFIVLILAFILPVTPQDYWWYMRLGRDVLGSGSIPRLDTFTFTRAGIPVDYQSWGAAILFYLVYRLGGLTLTVFLRGLLLAITYSLVWLTARRSGAGQLGSALVLLAAILTTSNNWSMRPQLFAYPLFALALFILYEWQNGRKKAVWVLPLLSLLWVNLHGSFIMLILLAGAALVFGRGDRRTLALVVGAILLATLVNPRGLGTWSYVFHSVTVPSSQLFSAEWLPPVNSGWQMNIFFAWLLAFPLLAHLSGSKLDRLEWIWFLGFGLLALLGERYVIWFVFILVVLTAKLVAGWEQQYIGDVKLGLPRLNLALGLVFLLLPLPLLPGLREKWWSQSPPATENTPIEATAWLADHPDLPGPLWSEIGFSSYLEFSLPQRSTWIDTRFEVFPVEQWQQYRDISLVSYNWSDLLDNTGVDLLMVSAQNQTVLITELDKSPHWCVLHRDPIAVVYQRSPCTGAP